MRYFWENDVIYSDFQPKIGTRKINGGAKFSEIKVQKTRVVMFVIVWNLARYLGKTYCVRKCKKKNGYREFDHSSTLTTEVFTRVFWLGCVLLPWQRGWLKSRLKMVFVYLKNAVVRLFSSFAHYELTWYPFCRPCCNKFWQRRFS